MQVTLHFLAQIKRAAGVSRQTLEIPAGATLREILETLAQQHGPEFHSLLTTASPSLLFFQGELRVGLDHAVMQDAQIDVVAPMAGG